MLADNVSILYEVSDDGKSVAYLGNLADDHESGDLYIAKAGEEPELIDTGVGLTYWTVFSGWDAVNMSNDGSAIAYLKNFDDNRLWGDLYLKQEGEEPQLIDENVSVGFDFFQ